MQERKARLLLRLEHDAEAIETARQALKINPSSAAIRKILAEALRQTDQVGLANEQLQIIEQLQAIRQNETTRGVVE